MNYCFYYLEYVPYEIYTVCMHTYLNLNFCIHLIACKQNRNISNNAALMNTFINNSSNIVLT